MTTSTSWSAQIAGRLTAGIGGVLLNVLMTKMVADWFAGREIATAMAIFINSWPAGIAVALMLLPAIGATLGLHAVNLAVAGLILIGLCLVYAGMLAGPAIGGKLSTSVGSASAALDFGAVVLLACPVVLWLFRRIVAGRYRLAVSST